MHTRTIIKHKLYLCRPTVHVRCNASCIVSNHLLHICEHKMPLDSVEANTNQLLVFSLFYCRHSVFYVVVNINVGICILKYPIQFVGF